MQLVTLEDSRVRLIPLSLENYKLLSHITKQKDLIFYSPNNISTPKDFKKYVKQALKAQLHGTALPFIIFDKDKQSYAGSTRFGNIKWEHKTLHIGWTWIGHMFQGTGLNKHVKFLMLQYAFESLEFEKVEFRIDERNTKSRKAVEKLGATLEGVLRKDTLMKNGFRRNTCCYGLLKEEWPTVKLTIFSEF